MIANKSPLLLKNFWLLNHNYHFMQPSEEVNISDLFNQYQIEMDFAFKKIQDHFQLFTKIGVNNIKNPLPGYLLFVEGVCFFSFEENSTLTEVDRSSLLQVSGLNICINNLRNILATTTANAPLGRYLLPSINLNKLLQDKHREQLLKRKEATVAAPENSPNRVKAKPKKSEKKQSS